MTITKCDICKKVIRKGDVEFSVAMIGNPALFARAIICRTCGKSIEALFKKHDLDGCREQIARDQERIAA